MVAEINETTAHTFVSYKNMCDAKREKTPFLIFIASLTCYIR
jgi:hypothetical protein